MGHGPCWAITTFARGNKFAVVAIEYITRWIEAKPLATITSESLREFFWQNIICRFGLPRTLMVDNGKQFDSDKFKEFCKNIGIKIAFALVYHPDSNGAVERANRVIFSVISKTIFNLRKGKWVEELPKVVWSHNTTTSRTAGFTPFKLLYSEEAMLPEEIKHQSLRVVKQVLAADEEYSKEIIEGTGLEAVENIIKYQEQTRRWRDS
jgi:transposase InsO family protein